ncbi:hypothetical protein CCU68_05075 [Pseudomonas gingeri NCPPB 3146 = LMG 5327]|uniref:Uncharacterized protein n=2 Tax=Pseudomonas gingeri TaxID=117681 RepID=A0A7Y7Y4K0_9PSED|nr:MULTISPECIES: hypothetical protein [Pseudomonas]NVZ27869.1 hypothetical protein [Pseudomonas gingeri]NWA05855.1 hypothetical protein [Pseudomonas gingeri]NWC17685.1 hypothetical protein [Pseudomonas gingeri]NWE46767.1 hypothetical protein [Pseudomonas gingeri]PNQ93686.1 hypothetical protein CCU68_05075 [Pseudomonas gingeri NCPPB 3146 = LMG 5327]
MSPLLGLPSLRDIAQRSASISKTCQCIAKSLAGWEGWPVSLREAQLRQIGSLAELAEEEATLDEYHPDGTSYWSVNAPIAPLYYPYNQCGVWECLECGRAYLRYNDDGAYHSESRIRSLDPLLIVDAPYGKS